MQTKRTVIKALAYDVLVVEVMQADALGMLFYLAEIHVREKRTGSQRLVRRSRIPGAGQELARDVRRLGLRALDHLTT